MAIPFESRDGGWDSSSQPWNKPKDVKTEDDKALIESLEPEQTLAPFVPTTVSERILAQTIEPTDSKVKGISIGLSRSSKWSKYFDEAERKNSLPEGSLLSIAAVESMGDPGAGSPAGAVGLMQMMPDTARSLDLTVDERLDERLDPVKSIDAAGRFFGNLVRKSGGDLNEALMKYNWGWGNVSGWKKNDPDTMPKETGEYLGRWNAAMRLQEESKAGINSPKP
jgi:membrane-bound lytic murein transglycosylase B|tara:strand:- start:9899 stop:10570 length:672 start_codon:yes stop_codon:yes gene_type:complete